MKSHLISIFLFAHASTAMAQSGMTCKDPEYLELKTASKVELKEGFCRSIRTANLNQSFVEITQDTIKELNEKHLDTSQQRQKEMEELKSRGSCRVAAGAYADALSRRFKLKPPTDC